MAFFWFLVWLKVFSINFRSFDSCVDRNAKDFNRSRATRAVANISKAFNRVWSHGVRSHGTSDQVLSLTSSFFSNKQLLGVLDGNSSQVYQINAGIPKECILGPILFLLYINDLPDDVIFNIAIYADDATFYSKYDLAYDLWKQLEPTSQVESYLWSTNEKR